MDEIFGVLEAAAKLEENANTRLEAATRYFQAVYLMRQYLSRLPATAEQQKKRDLIDEKVRHYEAHGRSIFASCNASVSTPDAQETVASDPRSPIAKECFFNTDSSVLPLPPPPELKRISSQSPAHRSSISSVVNQTASRANAKLSHAMDLDEQNKGNLAVEAYMEAAELYLKAIKASDTHGNGSQKQVESVVAILKRRLEQTLDRVEMIKTQKRPTSVVKEQRVKDNKQQQKLQRTKAASDLTAEEISVLKRSSLIASGLFLPWSDEDADELNRSLSTTARNLFVDPDGLLPLAEKQKKRLYKWARPSEILQVRQHHSGGAIGSPAMALNNVVSPYTIRQHGVTDCSFIASLCICSAFERRFEKRIITNIAYPLSSSTDQMTYNPEGKYMVKLWLNGVPRQVIVDDSLPIDRYGNLLCAHTKCPKGQLELWVSIIEKAYMKLCGGYDFPGSNSGVDLFSLTGWIPERILFPKDASKVRDFETAPERAWERLFSASSYGDCLITMSSEANLTDEQSDSIGIVTGHAYAVLSVIETSNGTRLLQLKNPWAHKGWKGRYSCYDDKSWSDLRFCAEVGYDPKLAQKQDDGVFWISWADVLVYFQNIHLSWNPALFAYRTTTHGFWPLNQGPIDDTFNAGENPQYVLTMSKLAMQKGASMWILISRHVSKQEQEGSDIRDFLTVHVHRNDESKERIWHSRSKTCVLVGAYTNNPHCLVRYDVEGTSDEYLSLVLSQFEKSHDLGYSLAVYCTEPFTLGRPAKELPFSRVISSGWTVNSAGGPIGKKTFYGNPMFAIDIPPGGAVVQLQCSAPKTMAVNVMIVPVSSYGKRVTAITGSPPLDSGNYKYAFVVTERTKLDEGAYTMIVSSYSQGEEAPFRVKVLSSVQLKVEALQ